MHGETLPLLESLIACHPDLELIDRRIWEAWDRDEIGSSQCVTLLGKLRQRRQADAEERRRLEDEFDAVEPAPEGVEAPEEGADGW